MRLFSAQYVFTVSGPVLKRPVIRTADDGTILSITDTGGYLAEESNLEFYNGIIVPGFVNSHCHLELSYLEKEISPGQGLHGFLLELNEKRYNPGRDKEKAAAEADRYMTEGGVVLCADICNSDVTFSLKKTSRIRYSSLLEVFGIDHNMAEERVREVRQLAAKASAMGIPWNITPHSVYSVPIPLFRMIKDLCLDNTLSSVHFLESEWEIPFIESLSGLLMETYTNYIPPGITPLTAKDHTAAVLEEVTPSGNLILVHNTFIEKKHIRTLKERQGVYYCLCPDSNLYIENRLPPLQLLIDESCNIIIGTDSLASNKKLDMLSALRTLQNSFSWLSLETLIQWATLNGAQALGAASSAGSIEPGKKPGLVLIKDTDLANLKLLPGSTAVRII